MGEREVLVGFGDNERDEEDETLNAGEKMRKEVGTLPGDTGHLLRN